MLCLCRNVRIVVGRKEIYIEVKRARGPLLPNWAASELKHVKMRRSRRLTLENGQSAHIQVLTASQTSSFGIRLREAQASMEAM